MIDSALCYVTASTSRIYSWPPRAALATTNGKLSKADKQVSRSVLAVLDWLRH